MDIDQVDAVAVGHASSSSAANASAKNSSCGFFAAYGVIGAVFSFDLAAMNFFSTPAA